MALPSLSPEQIALLRVVRLCDEDHGGLASEDLTGDDYETMALLCDLNLVEAIGEYGEAPDGEEDEREAGGSFVVYRITQGGVMILADEPKPDLG